MLHHACERSVIFFLFFSYRHGGPKRRDTYVFIKRDKQYRSKRSGASFYTRKIIPGTAVATRGALTRIITVNHTWYTALVQGTCSVYVLVYVHERQRHIKKSRAVLDRKVRYSGVVALAVGACKNASIFKQEIQPGRASPVSHMAPTVW